MLKIFFLKYVFSWTVIQTNDIFNSSAMLPKAQKLPSFCQSLDVKTKNADQCLKKMKKHGLLTTNYTKKVKDRYCG